MVRVRPASVRGTLYLLVGFGLLLTPVLVDTFDVGDPDRYQYEAAELTVHDNGTVDVPIQVGRADSSVACFESRPSRACMLEHGIHERGGIQYDGVSSSILYHDYQFVYIYGEGFFEPTTTDVNDTIEYSLTHVPHTEALDIVATDSDRVSTGLREAITTGESVTSDELEGLGKSFDTTDRTTSFTSPVQTSRKRNVVDSFRSDSGCSRLLASVSSFAASDCASKRATRTNGTDRIGRVT